MASVAIAMLQSGEVPAQGLILMTAGSIQPAANAIAERGGWVQGLEPARVRYFKRYRMEIDLNGLPPIDLPQGYAFLGWHPSLLDAHVEALHASFFQGIDTVVFPSLGDRVGCRHLMTEISRRSGFEPWATWLLTHGSEHVGTV